VDSGNISFMTQNPIAKFVIFSIRKILVTKCVGMFMVYLQNKLHFPVFGDSLVIGRAEQIHTSASLR